MAEMRKLTVLLVVLALTACGKTPTESSESATNGASDNRLEAVLDAQSETIKARYQYRHPQGTIDFFGVMPGMTIVEVLPGGGWYTRILLPFLGRDGHLIGADYALDMYPKFGFYDDEILAAKKSWISDWTAEAESWRDDDSASVSAFVLGSMPDELAGTVDAVLFIRALHNLNRFEDDGGYLTAALDDAYRVLKPGGIVGVVQHLSDNHMPDEWADGSNGYLKERLVIARMEAAGFEFWSGSGINANDRDQPGEEDFVWRLPPTLAGSEDDSELRVAMQAIGESNRMTMLFRKPE
jgi:predicted methyltransferase